MCLYLWLSEIVSVFTSAASTTHARSTVIFMTLRILRTPPFWNSKTLLIQMRVYPKIFTPKTQYHSTIYWITRWNVTFILTSKLNHTALKIKSLSCQKKAYFFHSTLSNSIVAMNRRLIRVPRGVTWSFFFVFFFTCQKDITRSGLLIKRRGHIFLWLFSYLRPMGILEIPTPYLVHTGDKKLSNLLLNVLQNCPLTTWD